MDTKDASVAPSGPSFQDGWGQTKAARTSTIMPTSVRCDATGRQRRRSRHETGRLLLGLVALQLGPDRCEGHPSFAKDVSCDAPVLREQAEQQVLSVDHCIG